jgi:ribosomal protein S18 acetylase RimI-like enzyme
MPTLNEVVLLEDELPTRAEALALYESAGWTSYTVDPDKLEQALAGSLKVVTARDHGRLVGLARVVGDGASIAYVQDVLTDREHRRQGLGRRLVEAVLAEYQDVYQQVLITDAENSQRAFYEALGFSELRDLPGAGLRGFARFPGLEFEAPGDPQQSGQLHR